jgi:4-amino-4-deoxy-L-arabinose transferase-like glycosyltransferase
MAAASVTVRRRVSALPWRFPPVVTLVPVALLAALLRLTSFGSVRIDPYYDAAVRSMTLSWHNFFYGAFEPGGSVSIDKAPVDLWLQVASVKLFGFSSVALRLPEAIAGALAVPLLYDVVRRLFGRGAGLAAATALAVLPVAVVTSRSDTMDSVMMLLLVLASWFVVRAAAQGRTWLLVAGGAAVGLAFNVKLFQALVPVPALALLYLLGAEGAVRARIARLAAAGVAMVAVGLSWVAVAGLAPLGARPYPIGSTNGSVWNVVFGFNGLDRLRGAPSPGAAALDPAGPLRLFTSHAIDYGSLVGTELLAALLLGGGAVLWAALIGRGGPATAERRLRRGGAAGLGLWLLLGAALFSAMGRMHPRYLEAITPAVAAVLGIGVARLAAGAAARRTPAVILALASAAAVLAAMSFAHVAAPVQAIAIVAAGLAAVLCVARVRRPAVLALAALAAVLVMPLARSAHLSAAAASDAGIAGAMPAPELEALSRYLLAHRAGATYEVASATVARAAPLIVHDALPVLMLTSLHGRPLTGAATIAADVQDGRLRYALLGNTGRCRSGAGTTVNCAPAVRWARAHATDVSAAAGLPHGLLYRLSPSPRATHTPSRRPASAPVPSHAARRASAIDRMLVIARHRYQEEASGLAVHTQLRRVAKDPALLGALRKGDLTALRAVVRSEQATPHAHISRTRVVRGNRILADAGVVFVVRPSQVALRGPGGRYLATLQLSIQDEIGYVRYMHRNHHVDIVVRGRGPQHIRTSLPAALQVKLPSRGSVTIAGRRYQVGSFSETALAGEPIRIWILLPA